MRKKWLLEGLLPAGLIALFGILYFLPYYQGYRFRASDQIQLEYMVYPLKQLHESTGQLPFWAPHLFGGMPAYLIYYKPAGKCFPAPFDWLEGLFRHYPPMIFFIGGLGFFIFLRVEGARWAWALGGALAFLLTSYYTNMIVATHWGKSNVLFSVPYLLAGMGLLHRGQIGWGTLLALAGWAGIVGGHHPQMAYYAMVVVGSYALFWLWRAWQEKKWRAYAGQLFLFLLTAAFGTLSQVTNLLPYYEYGQYSIRGGSELERDTEKDPSLQSGLDKEYAQSYSASRAEIWTLVIPDFAGGTSQEDVFRRLGRNAALVEAFTLRGIQDFSFLRAVPTYWGGSPFSAGSFYVSAIAFFLMLLGWMYGLEPIDWILAYGGWIVILLALGAYGYSLWGSAALLLLPVVAYGVARLQKTTALRALTATAVFLGGWGLISSIDDSPESTYKLTDWALEYLPFYNKFRAPSTWLVVMGFILPYLGIRGVMRFLAKPEREKLLLAVGLSVAIILLIGVGGSWIGFSFEGTGDMQLRSQAQLPDWFMEALREDRIAIARQSGVRSAFWILAAGGTLLLFLLRYISETVAGGILTLLFLIDGWLLNISYFPRKESYVRSQEVPMPPPQLPHERFIAADSGYFRVLPLHTNAFTDARPSVFFENAGGYHPAKLKRYQQFIEAHLSRLTPEALKMLAIRYITGRVGMTPPPGYDSVAQTADEVVIFRAQDSLPIAWLVEGVKTFPRNDQVLDSVGVYPVHRIALMKESDWQRLPIQPAPAPLSPEERVLCTRRSAYELEYQVRTTQPRLLVLSEVYYPHDWEATVNGAPTPIFPANYILRAVVVPAGESIVRLRSRSAVYERGEYLSTVGSVGAWTLAVGMLAWEFFRRRRSSPPSP